MGRKFAKELWTKTQQVAGTDATVASALLAQAAKGEAQRLLADVVAHDKATTKAALAVVDEMVDEPTKDEPVAPSPPAARARELPRTNARQGAVRLVTLIESRARARGLPVDRSPARADHAVSISHRGAIFCTVSAVNGELFVDAAPGPAPCARAALGWDEVAEVFLPTDTTAWPDPVALIEQEIALMLRAVRARAS